MFMAERKKYIKAEYEKDKDWIRDLIDAGLEHHARVMRRIVNGDPVTGIEADDLFHLIKSSKQQKDEQVTPAQL